MRKGFPLCTELSPTVWGVCGGGVGGGGGYILNTERQGPCPHRMKFGQFLAA